MAFKIFLFIGGDIQVFEITEKSGSPDYVRQTTITTIVTVILFIQYHHRQKKHLKVNSSVS